MPVAVIESLLDMCADVESVIDPFMGSGATMYACQNNGLNCVGIEIEKKYCDLIQSRCFHRTFLDREVKYEFSQFNKKANQNE